MKIKQKRFKPVHNYDISMLKMNLSNKKRTQLMRLVAFCFFMLFSSTVFAQEEPRNSTESEEAAAPEENTSEEASKQKTLTEERKETLNYGIHSEIVGLLNTLTEEKNEKLAVDVLAVFKDTYNPEVLVAAADYFMALDFKDGHERAFSLLNEEDRLTDEVVAKLIRYLSTSEKKKYYDRIKTFIDYDSQNVILAALKAIGGSGHKEYVSFLLDKLEDEDFPSSLKPNILLALGSLKSKEAVPMLMEIVEDDREEIIWRQFACDALGKIGDPAAVEVLREAANSDNALLRAYALFALGNFTQKEATDTLMEGLRDSYWKSRVRAAEGLAEQGIKEAVPILTYKAEKDPERSVREAAITALGKIGGNEAFSTVTDIFTSEKSPFALRFTALETLIKHNPAGTAGIIKKEIEKHWSAPHTKYLSTICKILAENESAELSGLFAKLLEHPSYLIKICALKGIQRNKFTGLREKVNKLTSEETPEQVRETALTVLESLD